MRLERAGAPASGEFLAALAVDADPRVRSAAILAMARTGAEPIARLAATAALQYASFETTQRCAEFVDAEPASAVTFFVVALFLGLLAYHVLSFVPIPYTAMLLVRSVVTP